MWLIIPIYGLIVTFDWSFWLLVVGYLFKPFIDDYARSRSSS